MDRWMDGCGRSTDIPWVVGGEKESNFYGKNGVSAFCAFKSRFCRKKKLILDQRYLLNKLLDPRGNLRGNSLLWTSVNESPRKLSVLIFSIFPAGAWPSPHGEYSGILSGIIEVLIKLWWLEAKELFPPSYITMFVHQGSIFNLSLLIKACHHSPLVRNKEEETCMWMWV